MSEDNVSNLINHRVEGSVSPEDFQCDVWRSKLSRMKRVDRFVLDKMTWNLRSCYFLCGFKNELFTAWRNSSGHHVLTHINIYSDTRRGKEELNYRLNIINILPSHEIVEVKIRESGGQQCFLYGTSSESSGIASMCFTPSSGMFTMFNNRLTFEFKESLTSCAINKKLLCAIATTDSCYFFDYNGCLYRDNKLKNSSVLEFNDDGNILYSGHPDGNLALYDVRIGLEQLGISNLMKFNKKINDVKVLEDRNTLVVCEAGGSLMNVDLRQRKVVFAYPEFTGAERKIPFNCNEYFDLLCATGNNGVARVWSLSQGKVLYNFPEPMEEEIKHTWLTAPNSKLRMLVLDDDFLSIFE